MVVMAGILRIMNFRENLVELVCKNGRMESEKDTNHQHAFENDSHQAPDGYTTDWRRQEKTVRPGSCKLQNLEHWRFTLNS